MLGDVDKKIGEFKKEVDLYKEGLTPEEIIKFDANVNDMLFRQQIYTIFSTNRRIGHAILIYYGVEEK